MYWTEASRSNNAVKFSDRQDKKLSFRVTDYLGKSLKITQGPSRSLELAQFDRSHDGSYWRSIVTMAISCTISQIKRDTVLVKNRDFFHIPYIPRPRRLRLITWLCDLDLWPWRSWRLWLMRVVIIRVPSLKFVGLAVRKLWRTMSMCVSINGSGDLELWSFDLETGMSVASKVGNLRSEFGHIRPLVSPLIRYVRDGLTKPTLTASFPTGVGIIMAINALLRNTQCTLQITDSEPEFIQCPRHITGPCIFECHS